MAIVQKNLLGWQEIDELGDLERLTLVLENLDDEKLMQRLEKERGKGRDDNPVRAMWNSVLAGVIYQHESIASLIRELNRNGDLLKLCGFNVVKGKLAVPSASAYTRFLKNLMEHQSELDDIMNKLIKELTELLPGLGKRLAIDSKAISSHARKPSKKTKTDDRRDIDANYGVKTYKGKRKDGTLWEQMKNWFGYKLHLIVDADYELPVLYKVTKASEPDTDQLLPMVKELNETHSEIIGRAEMLTADKGYDSRDNNKKLWDKYNIKPIIDIRDTWKYDRDTKQVDEDIVDSIVYDYQGNVYCINPKTSDKQKLSYYGFEKNRGCLKYRCKLSACGVKCNAEKICRAGKKGKYGRVVRIPLKKDRRIFTPIARSSYKFKREYKKRTAVERVNSRLDVSFGFEKHYIRGMKKMKLRCGLAMIVMLSMALGRARQNQEKYIRSLVKIPKAA
jgi:transposase